MAVLLRLPMLHVKLVWNFNHRWRAFGEQIVSRSLNTKQTAIDERWRQDRVVETATFDREAKNDVINLIGRIQRGIGE